MSEGVTDCDCEGDWLTGGLVALLSDCRGLSLTDAFLETCKLVDTVSLYMNRLVHKLLRKHLLGTNF